ncbi:MAG TPA: hypothetical protein PK711_13960 [Bacteroidales bacterium]|nr:hypothetical protein [Bacteroidales bacterium]
MDTFLEIVKYILPSLVVMVTAYLVMRSFLENELRRKEAEQRSGLDKTLLPLRLQAYERMILYLERIAPANLILRVSKPEMDAEQLQTIMVRTIREEFDHNLSQQLYLSDEAWEQIKKAKEDMIRMINTASTRLELNAPSHELASALFEELNKEKILPFDKAIILLKKEFREMK